jgi:hypothetical protein
MVAAARTMICVVVALVSAACGIALRPADEGADDGDTAGTNDTVNTKGATMPAPGSNGEAGVSVNGSSSGADGSAGGVRSYVVFVTSASWTASQVGGLTGADGSCTTLANAQTELAGKRWAAWLSTSSASAIGRLGTTPGPWVRVDGVKVAEDRSHLTDTSRPLLAAISVDEKRGGHGDFVWTGTRGDGTASDQTCNGWSSLSGRGLYGKIGSGKPDWTSFADISCDGGKSTFSDDGNSVWWTPDSRLYCFEID